jgi:hypothetical protein
MDLNLALQEFDTALTNEYKKYLDTHKELDVWRGKELTDESVVVVNDILKRIQDQYTLLYGAFHFIKERSPLALNAMKEYAHFVDTINGAKTAHEEIVEN